MIGAPSEYMCSLILSIISENVKWGSVLKNISLYNI